MQLKPKDMRDIAFTALAAMAGALLAPSLPVLGVPIAALAVGWLTYRFGPRAGVVASVAATAVVLPLFAETAAMAASSAVFILPALLAAGPGAAWALRRWQVTSVVSLLTVVLFAGVMAGLVIQTTAAHTTITAQSAAEAKVAVDALVKGVGSQDPATAAKLKEQSADLAGQVAALWPASVFLSVAFAAAIAVPALSWLGCKMGATVAVLPALADLDLSFHLVWPAIAGVAFLALAAAARGALPWASAAGLNLLLAIRPALFLQGLATFAALYRKVGLGRFGRSFGFLLLGVSEAVIPSVSIVGVADLFFNVRKLQRDGAGAAAARV